MRVELESMRKRRGLNQRELAEKSGVPQPIISQIEIGHVKSPGIQVLYKLARALKCTVDDLIEDDEGRKGA